MKINMLKITLMVMLLFPLVSMAQIVEDDWIETSKKYQEKYPDNDAIILKSTERYTFEVVNSKANPTVKAYKDVATEYMALKDFKFAPFGDGYDSFSDVKRLKGEESYGKKYKQIALQINDTEASADELFDHDARVKYIILPLKTRGMKCRGEYYKEYQDVRYLTSTYFADKQPIVEKEIIVEVPQNVSIDIREFNFDGYIIDKKIETNEKKNLQIYTYTIKNYAPIKNEFLSPAIGKVYPHLVFEAKNFTTRGGEKIQLFESTLDQYNWYKSLVSQIENNNDGLQPLVDRLTKDKTTDEEKMKAIFYWVQDNIKYLAFERGIAGFKPDAASKVYENKFGDCKGMANLLTTMLKMAGYDARLSWIGTHSIPYSYDLHSLVVDNHMICALKHNGKTYFLDGTESYIALGDYAQRIQGKQVLIEDGEGKYLLETVPTLPNERNLYSETAEINLAGDKLECKVAEIYKGESQTSFLQGVNTVAQNQREKVLKAFLSGSDKNIEITNLSTLNFEDREKPIDIKYDAAVANKTTSLGDELYVSIDFSNDFENYIMKEDRISAIEISDNLRRKFKKTFIIPNNYEVKYLPKKMTINEPNIKMNIAYETTGNSIVFTKDIEIKKQLVPPSGFENWNATFKKLKAMNNEQIILNKK